MTDRNITPAENRYLQARAAMDELLKDDLAPAVEIEAGLAEYLAALEDLRVEHARNLAREGEAAA